MFFYSREVPGIIRAAPYSAPDRDKSSQRVNGELSIVRPHRGESHAVPAGTDSTIPTHSRAWDVNGC